MDRLLFLLIFVSSAAFSQDHAEYVILNDERPSFFFQKPTPELAVNTAQAFVDTDRATRHYNNYFSRPVDWHEAFRDCRFAYEPDIFDVVTGNVMNEIFPEVKW